jgi:uncharacterized protein (TIGR02246 family)
MPLRLVVTTMAIAAALMPAAPAGQSAADDRAAVIAVTQEYRSAWVANDAERVMRTITKDAVLMPSGMAPIEGENAIRRFWFPAGGPRTTVTAMELRVNDVQVSGGLAVVSGEGTLTFVVTGPVDTRAATQGSWYVNVLRRQADGRWLIVRRAWSDRRG